MHLVVFGHDGRVEFTVSFVELSYYCFAGAEDALVVVFVGFAIQRGDFDDEVRAACKDYP